MKLVLLSGGSGKRLWPLSNDARSKQFLPLLEGEHGKESMVQRVWRQLGVLGLQDHTHIATSKSQEDIMKSQLGEGIPLIMEPERRDTFPAIALACVYLFDVLKISRDETICFLPVDPFVEDSFFHTLLKLEDVLGRTGADIGLVGVSPTYPSAKYGYIIPHAEVEESADLFQSVRRFVEKPSEQLAAHIIEQERGLWNCGIFAFRLQYLLDQLQVRYGTISFEDFVGNYSNMPRISFDYEVVEKADNVVVIKYSGYWKDIGTWNTLSEELLQPVIGIGAVSNDCSNTHIINELDIPVQVLGISDAVVAASPDGILVCDKEASSRLKDEIYRWDGRPMYEERVWGWRKTLDYRKSDSGEEVLTKRVRVQAGKNMSYHCHHQRKEIWTIISGQGEVIVDRQRRTIRYGDVIQIPPGQMHSVYAISDLEFIEVQIGELLSDSDVYREHLLWSEAEHGGAPCAE